MSIDDKEFHKMYLEKEYGIEEYKDNYNIYVLARVYQRKISHFFRKSVKEWKITKNSEYAISYMMEYIVNDKPCIITWINGEIISTRYVSDKMLAMFIDKHPEIFERGKK